MYLDSMFLCCAQLFSRPFKLPAEVSQLIIVPCNEMPLPFDFFEQLSLVFMTQCVCTFRCIGICLWCGFFWNLYHWHLSCWRCIVSRRRCYVSSDRMRRTLGRGSLRGYTVLLKVNNVGIAFECKNPWLFATLRTKLLSARCFEQTTVDLVAVKNFPSSRFIATIHFYLNRRTFGDRWNDTWKIKHKFNWK